MRLVLTQPKRRLGEGKDIAAIGRALERTGFAGAADDVIVLPEGVSDGQARGRYEEMVASLAQCFGCHVVGGSHVEMAGDKLVNEGVVMNGAGEIVARYAKSNPYGAERHYAADHGMGATRFRIGDAECLAMICADFFHAEMFQGLAARPDLIFVPAFSVSRKATPHMARARWRHAMIARAFEQAAYVAVSDWAYPVMGHISPSSGVAGLAQPDPPTPAELLQTLGRRSLGVFAIDLDAARLLRTDQQDRGFDIARQRKDGP